MESYGNVNSLLICAVKTDELLTAGVVKNLLVCVCVCVTFRPSRPRCNSRRYGASCWQPILHRRQSLTLKLHLLPLQGTVPTLGMFICIHRLGIYEYDILVYIRQVPLLQMASYVESCQSSSGHVLAQRQPRPSAVCIFRLNKVKDELNRLFVIQLTYQSEAAARRPDWQPYPEPTNKANPRVFLTFTDKYSSEGSDGANYSAAQPRHSTLTNHEIVMCWSNSSWRLKLVLLTNICTHDWWLALWLTS